MTTTSSTIPITEVPIKLDVEECIYEGNHHEIGSVFHTHNCIETCSCLAGGLIECSPLKCPIGLFAKGQARISRFCIELTNRPETDECCSMVVCATGGPIQSPDEASDLKRLQSTSESKVLQSLAVDSSTATLTDEKSRDKKVDELLKSSKKAEESQSSQVNELRHDKKVIQLEKKNLDDKNTSPSQATKSDKSNLLNSQSIPTGRRVTEGEEIDSHDYMKTLKDLEIVLNADKSSVDSKSDLMTEIPPSSTNVPVDFAENAGINQFTGELLMTVPATESANIQVYFTSTETSLPEAEFTTVFPEVGVPNVDSDQTEFNLTILPDIVPEEEEEPTTIIPEAVTRISVSMSRSSESSSGIHVSMQGNTSVMTKDETYEPEEMKLRSDHGTESPDINIELLGVTNATASETIAPNAEVETEVDAEFEVTTLFDGLISESDSILNTTMTVSMTETLSTEPNLDELADEFVTESSVRESVGDKNITGMLKREGESISSRVEDGRSLKEGAESTLLLNDRRESRFKGA